MICGNFFPQESEEAAVMEVMKMAAGPDFKDDDEGGHGEYTPESNRSEHSYEFYVDGAPGMLLSRFRRCREQQPSHHSQVCRDRDYHVTAVKLATSPNDNRVSGDGATPQDERLHRGGRGGGAGGRRPRTGGSRPEGE